MSDESSQAAPGSNPAPPSSGGASSDARPGPSGAAPGERPAPIGAPSGASGSAPARPSSRYTMGTFPNMVRSLVVVAALVLVLLAIVPRVSSVDQPAVDAPAKGRYVASQVKLPLEVALGLPAGWKAVSATFGPNQGLPTWQVSYLTPSGEAVALRQAQSATPVWVDAVTADGARSGEQTVAGRLWEQRWSPDKRRISLVRVPSGEGVSSTLTTVVTGTGSLEEVRTLTGALQPMPIR